MDITTIVTCKEIENVRFQHWNWLLDLNDEKEGNVISRIAPVFFFLYKILAPFLPLKNISLNENISYDLSTFL